MSDDPVSVEAWQEEENWCKKNGWDLLTYLRSKPIIITKDALGQAVPDYKATEVVRTLTKQHQERCEMAANEIERLRKERDEATRLLHAMVKHIYEITPLDKNPKHDCDFEHRPDVGSCKFCEDWTASNVLLYGEEYGKENTND